jgi:tetratricopeptide (TPR) repeat protein
MLIGDINNKKSFKKFAQQFDNEKSKLNIDEKVDKAIELIQENKFQSAYKILGKLIKNFEAGKSFENNEKFALYSFNGPMEHAMKAYENKKNNINQELMHIGEDKHSYFNMYYYFADALIELEKFDEAEDAIKKAIRWNPVSDTGYIQYATIAHNKNNPELEKELINKALEYTYNPTYMALCYTVLGYYYANEKQQYELALSLFAHSMNYKKDNSEAIDGINDIFQILSNSGRKIDLKSNSNYLKEILLKNNIPYEASDLVKDSINYNIEICEELNDFEEINTLQETLSQITINK